MALFMWLLWPREREEGTAEGIRSWGFLQAEQAVPGETGGRQGGTQTPKRLQVSGGSGIWARREVWGSRNRKLSTYPTSRLPSESWEVVGSQMHVCMSVCVRVPVCMHACSNVREGTAIT